MTATATLTLVSDYFGAMECDPSTLFHFPRGLPGFECERHFAAIEIPSQWPLVYLQSMNRPDLCLMTIPPRTVRPDYQLQLAVEDKSVLGFAADFTPNIAEDVLCLAILSIERGRDATANLLGPLVINLATREAVQAIQFDSDWTCDHPLPQAASC